MRRRRHGRAAALVLAGACCAAALGCAGPDAGTTRTAATTVGGLLPAPPPNAAAGTVVRLLSIPFEPPPPGVGRAVDELVRFVESRTALRLRVVVFDTYAAVEDALVAGEGDAAMLSPLLYVETADRFAREPALRRVRLRLLASAVSGGSPTYLGYVVAAADGPVHELGDVGGRGFGMVEGSTSGYLYPLDLAEARGLDPRRLFAGARFYDSHADILADLLRPAGERPIEAGALYQHIVDTLDPALRARVRIVAKTARIPRDALVARIPLVDGREDPRALQVAAALQHALLDLDQDAEASDALRAGIGDDGWIAGDDRRYDAIRKVHQRFGRERWGAEPGGPGGTEAAHE